MKNQDKGVFDRDRMRENIHECCQRILIRSPRVLEFILCGVHKNSLPSEEEFLNFNELRDSGVMIRNIRELWLTLKGRRYYLPSSLECDQYTLSSLSQIARPIFIEEAQMLLQSQECSTHDSDDDLFDPLWP